MAICLSINKMVVKKNCFENNYCTQNSKYFETLLRKNVYIKEIPRVQSPEKMETIIHGIVQSPVAHFEESTFRIVLSRGPGDNEI